MNRSDLIDELAARFVNLTKSDTEFAVNTLWMLCKTLWWQVIT